MTKMFIIILAVSFSVSSLAQDSIKINSEGYCSSFATTPLESLSKKAGAKECAKESALFLAVEQCLEIGAREVKETKSKFAGCDKAELFEEGKKIIEHKCFYTASARCLLK